MRAGARRRSPAQARRRSLEVDRAADSSASDAAQRPAANGSRDASSPPKRTWPRRGGEPSCLWFAHAGSWEPSSAEISQFPQHRRHPHIIPLQRRASNTVPVQINAASSAARGLPNVWQTPWLGDYTGVHNHVKRLTKTRRLQERNPSLARRACMGARNGFTTLTRPSIRPS